MILFIGRLVGVKGVDKLIMSLPHILQKNPKAKLVIVGLGDLPEYLTNLVKATKMSDFVNSGLNSSQKKNAFYTTQLATLLSSQVSTNPSE